jgi:hypothetical protein
MVEIRIEPERIVVEVKGLHQLWALKRKITFPRTALRSARPLSASEAHGWWKGLRLPGTHVPGVIVAGSYRHDGAWHFWDVSRGDRALELVLDGQHYERLFVEVEDRERVLRELAAVTASS